MSKLRNISPKACGADDERSETFTLPVRWAVGLTSRPAACRKGLAVQNMVIMLIVSNFQQAIL